MQRDNANRPSEDSDEKGEYRSGVGRGRRKPVSSSPKKRSLVKLTSQELESTFDVGDKVHLGDKRSYTEWRIARVNKDGTYDIKNTSSGQMKYRVNEREFES